jgi:hypothetical protein
LGRDFLKELISFFKQQELHMSNMIDDLSKIIWEELGIVLLKTFCAPNRIIT